MTCRALALLLLAALGMCGEPAVALEPAYLRVEVAGGATAVIRFTVNATAAGSIIAAESDCRCLKVTSPLPMVLEAGKPATIEASVAGVETGVELLVLRTTLGPLHAQVQVVTGGLGQGKDVLANLLKRAGDEKLAAWLLVHDLQGQVRNCGCSSGSLGGIDHLAALPALCRSLAPTTTVRWLLSGDVDGAKPGVGEALKAAGWEQDDAAVQIATDPAPLLTKPGITAVVVPAACPLNHRRLVRPLGSGGMTIQALLVDAEGAIRHQVAIPVDATLPGEAAILARFPGRLSTPIDEQADPADDCRTCHRTAHKTWKTTAHARAWDSLKPADRVDECVGCHTTPVTNDKGPALALGVTCQSCHLGTAAHNDSGGDTRTTGVVSCQRCHNAKHHPGFRRDEAWKAIVHGSDPKKKKKDAK